MAQNLVLPIVLREIVLHRHLEVVDNLHAEFGVQLESLQGPLVVYLLAQVQVLADLDACEMVVVPGVQLRAQMQVLADLYGCEVIVLEVQLLVHVQILDDLDVCEVVVVPVVQLPVQVHVLADLDACEIVVAEGRAVLEARILHDCRGKVVPEYRLFRCTDKRYTSEVYTHYVVVLVLR